MAEATVQTGVVRRLYPALLTGIFAAYIVGRVLQVITGPTPRLSLVAVEVLAALAFALLDGARTLGLRGIATLIVVTIVIGNGVENLGVATGFPFGRYEFLQLMGPRLLHVPILLGLAYIGMGYACWTMARAVAGSASRVPGTVIPAAPVLASCMMVAWDLAQDPVWSTLLHAWVWHEGGSWFGVPWSNYTGWFLTNLLIFSAFQWAGTSGRFVRRQPRAREAMPAAALYLLCASGNVLQLLARRTAPLAQDGTGHWWSVSAILASSALVSVVAMGGFGVLAVGRSLRVQSATD